MFVASLCPITWSPPCRCRNLCKEEIIKDEERAMIEGGLRKNQKPLLEHEIAVCGGEEDTILASLTTICSGSLKSLRLHIPICVRQMGISNAVI